MSGRRVRVWAPVLFLSLVAGWASTVPLTVFQPRDTASVKSFFRNGAAIGAIYGDSVFALAQIEPVYFAKTGDEYARLWLLVENHSSKPMLVEPLKCAALRIESTRSKKTPWHNRSWHHKRADIIDRSTVSPLNLTPASPTTILATISNAQASSAILGTIGAVLQAAAVQPTTLETSGSSATSYNPTSGTSYKSTTTINDTGAKQQRIRDRSMVALASTDDWYESFKNSMNQGILRRNTLFPGEGVNGYIYFKLAFGGQHGSADSRYVITLTMPDGQIVVTFDPIEGE